MTTSCIPVRKSLVEYTTESSDDEEHCNEEIHGDKLKLKEWLNNGSDDDPDFETKKSTSNDHDTSDTDVEDTNVELHINTNPIIENVEGQEVDEATKVTVKEFISEAMCTATGVKNYNVNNIYNMFSEEYGYQKLSTMSKQDIIDKTEFILENNLHLKSPFCNYCLKKFKNKKNMVDHVRMIHQKCPKKYQCEACDKSYMSEAALQYHTDVSHSDSSSVKCSLCDKTFGHKTSLVRHMKIHNQKIFKFECEHCTKFFVRKDELVRHRKNSHKKVNIATNMVKILKEDEKFRCKDCNEVCEDGIDMVTHLVHKCKENQHYSCKECDRKFVSKFNLERHRRNMHTNNASTVSCKSCDYITKRKENLSRHVVAMHKSSA